ncbi:ATP synthase subunit I [Paludicola sp. MB14-C6]|uniref:ATP synthase subunit I n=1 Tax=Paludihabitans sp. MB14-C6 TaxID=3070656 RepID=UPI0027DD0AAA|nr:ATP synthase subunit I [Paludicola sp. MB14-C6]WMJ21828.1 ATP synthase subunit I [Paludicola sp. MB14-C6]
MLILDILILFTAIFAEAVDLSLFLGILLGNVYCILNFALLGTVVENAVERSPISAKHYLRRHYILRFILMGAVFAVSFLSPLINGWCVVVSAFAPKITYTCIGFYQMLIHKRGDKLGR